jgi:hypothetical protein
MIEIDAHSDGVAAHWRFDGVVGFLADRIRVATTRSESWREVVGSGLLLLCNRGSVAASLASVAYQGASPSTSHATLADRRVPPRYEGRDRPDDRGRIGWVSCRVKGR